MKLAQNNKYKAYRYCLRVYEVISLLRLEAVRVNSRSNQSLKMYLFFSFNFSFSVRRYMKKGGPGQMTFIEDD